VDSFLRASGSGCRAPAKLGFILQLARDSRYPGGQLPVASCQLPVKPSTTEGTGSHRVDLIRLAFYMFGEHFFGVDGYEDSLAAGQDFAVLVQDFGGVYVGSALYFDLAAFYAQRFVKRDWL